MVYLRLHVAGTGEPNLGRPEPTAFVARAACPSRSAGATGALVLRADYVVDAAVGAGESRVKSKKAIKEEVLEYFYAETGGWPVDDKREQREERENGEEREERRHLHPSPER